MALKIIWSEFTETQLDDIYDYYKKKAGAKIADVFDTRQNPIKLKRTE